MLRFEVFARTEVGCARERNEDSFLVLHLGTGEAGLRPEARIAALETPGTVLAVCDGMGGAAAGDLASKLALHALDQVMRSHAPIHGIERERRRTRRPRAYWDTCVMSAMQSGASKVCSVT